MLRWGILLGLSVVTAAGIICACDNIERDTAPRYYVAPDANEPQNNNPNNPDGALPSGDAMSTEGSDATTDGPPSGPFDPASLQLTGWWRSAYAASPWVGVASAGTSLGRDLAEPTNPPIAGVPLNGMSPPSFDGLNDSLATTATVAQLLSATAWEVAGLFSADSARTYIPSTAYNFPALLAEGTAGDFYVSFSSAGIMAGHYDGIAFREIVGACPVGGLHAFQAWFNGTTLNLVIDGGLPITPVASANGVLGTGVLRVGANFTQAAYFDGVVVEIMTAAKMLDPAARSGIRSYFNTRYGTKFPL